MAEPSYSDEEVRRLLTDALLDELYQGLAASLPGNEGFGSNAVAKGKATFNSLQARLRRDLCPQLENPKIQSLIDSTDSSDAISLVAVMASLISSLGLALNTTLVAVLIIRTGLRRLCTMS